MSGAEIIPIEPDTVHTVAGNSEIAFSRRIFFSCTIKAIPVSFVSPHCREPLHVIKKEIVHENRSTHSRYSQS